MRAPSESQPSCHLWIGQQVPGVTLIAVLHTLFSQALVEVGGSSLLGWGVKMELST